mmetsp:Transcript_23052/g.37961  ORF Transcript_23052/g.37961 Transcript_23052/m.37961 type:complete len:405 (+) Transcript_23052:80-1294(+)
MDEDDNDDYVPSDMEEDERGRNHRSSGDEPTLNLQDLIAVACALGASHPLQIPTGNILESAQALTHYGPFVDFLIEEGYAGPDAPFLDHCNYPMLLRSMPTVMQPITHEIQTWGDDMDPSFFSECYIAAFTCGDGSIYCGSHRRNENGVRSRPTTQLLAIKEDNDNHPFKEWLSHRYVYARFTVRCITPRLLKQKPFVYANYVLLSYKKLPWMVVVKLAQATRVGTTQIAITPLARIAATIQIVVVSWLNALHGVMLSEQWFRDDFQQMARKRCVFDLFVAGILGSDGGIYIGYHIYQSNRRWCKALAHTMQHVYGLERLPTINPIRASTKGICTRPATSISMSVSDSEKIAPRIAAFDMNRKDQQIVYLLRRLMRHSPNFPNKKRVEKFLEGTAKFLRKKRPS